MTHKWNLDTSQWAEVLLNETTPEKVAHNLQSGVWLPWTTTLLERSDDSKTVLDLGSGRGENSAVLALNGRTPTLLEWSEANLAFSERLFDTMGLDGRFCQADMTRPLPFRDESFDMVFSCGVFEYFDSATIDAILKEAFRIARKRVIIMVPNAASIAYRIGMWHMKLTGKWQWGGEVPSYSLTRNFARAGSIRTIEFSVGAQHSLNFLTMPTAGTIRKAITRLCRLTDSPRPTLLRQGYLLITVGEK